MAKVRRSTKTTPAAAKSTPTAKTTPAAAPAGSARPGKEEQAAAAPEKKKRVDYPGLFDDAGEEQRLHYLPTEAGEQTYTLGDEEITVEVVAWDEKLHKPLLRKHFANEVLFFSWRAHTFRLKAAEFDKKAEDAKRVGSKADQAKLRRLQKMREQMAKLEAALTEAGIDIDELDEEDES